MIVVTVKKKNGDEKQPKWIMGPSMDMPLYNEDNYLLSTNI